VAQGITLGLISLSEEGGRVKVFSLLVLSNFFQVQEHGKHVGLALFLYHYLDSLLVVIYQLSLLQH